MEEYNVFIDIHKKIDAIWNEVLFDGEEIINCCEIPYEMYLCIIEQIMEVLFDEFSVIYSNYSFNNLNHVFFHKKIVFYSLWHEQKYLK